jgi:hypothetical protein
MEVGQGQIGAVVPKEIEYLQMGLGLVIRFTGCSNAAHDYTLQFTVTHTY